MLMLSADGGEPRHAREVRDLARLSGEEADWNTSRYGPAVESSTSACVVRVISTEQVWAGVELAGEQRRARQSGAVPMLI
jgi:hypothetical protein